MQMSSVFHKIICVYYIEKKGEKRNNTIKKYVVHSSALLRCEFILRIEAHTKNFLYEGEFFFVFPSAIFAFSLYLCSIESIHYMYSEWMVWTMYIRTQATHNAHHPSLIHSFSLPSIYKILLVLWFIREILFPSASTSSYFFAAFALAVVIVYVSNSFFWCNAYISFFSILSFYSEGCQWWMRKERAQRAISIHL